MPAEVEIGPEVALDPVEQLPRRQLVAAAADELASWMPELACFGSVAVSFDSVVLDYYLLLVLEHSLVVASPLVVPSSSVVVDANHVSYSSKSWRYPRVIRKVPMESRIPDAELGLGPELAAAAGYAQPVAAVVEDVVAD